MSVPSCLLHVLVQGFVYALCHSLKWLMLKLLCVKFCVQVFETVSETCMVLQKAFGDEALSHAKQYFDGFKN